MLHPQHVHSRTSVPRASCSHRLPMKASPPVDSLPIRRTATVPTFAQEFCCQADDPKCLASCPPSWHQGLDSSPSWPTSDPTTGILVTAMATSYAVAP